MADPLGLQVLEVTEGSVEQFHIGVRHGRSVARTRGGARRIFVLALAGYLLGHGDGSFVAANWRLRHIF
jgi:hypothetical protein